MQTQPAAARLPLRPMLVVEQSLVRRPGLAAVARLEQARRLDAGPHQIGIVGGSGENLPDLNERESRLFGKAHVLALRSRP